MFLLANILLKILMLNGKLSACIRYLVFSSSKFGQVNDLVLGYSEDRYMKMTNIHTLVMIGFNRDKNIRRGMLTSGWEKSLSILATSSVIQTQNKLSLKPFFNHQIKVKAVFPYLYELQNSDLTLKNFCPISNLQFVSKLVERAAAGQLQSHLVKNNLFGL